LPEKEQIVISWVNLSFDDRESYTTQEPTRFIADLTKSDDELDEEINKQTAEMIIRTDNPGMADSMKITIANLSDMDGNPIDTWENLKKAKADPGIAIDVLIREIQTHVTGNAKKPTGKNSE
jgi:hypothetical protein